MYASSTFILTAILALTRVAIATPPACLLSAIGVQANPADLKSLCGTLEPQVVGNITERCAGDNLSSAQSAFSSTCLSSESVTIHFSSSTSSAASSSKTGFTSATMTGSSSKTTATSTSGSGSSSGSGSKTSSTPTATGSGASTSATGTNAASPMTPQNGYIMAPLVLAAGFAGQYFL